MTWIFETHGCDCHAGSIEIEYLDPTAVRPFDDDPDRLDYGGPRGRYLTQAVCRKCGAAFSRPQ